MASIAACTLVGAGCIAPERKPISLVGRPPNPVFGPPPSRIIYVSPTPRPTPMPIPRVADTPAPQKPTRTTFEAPDNWLPAHLSRRWRKIIVHHSASPGGSARGIHAYHLSKGWDGLGYHFVIGNGIPDGNGRRQRDGEAHVGYRWRRQKNGAHAGKKFNGHSIGICLIGNFQASRPSDKQMQSLVRLVKYLMQTCDIPADQIYPHREVRATRCPGRQFPWSDFMSRIVE
jgi:hypothetical protein